MIRDGRTKPFRTNKKHTFDCVNAGKGSREISKDVRAVANIALNVRDVSTDDQTTGNERRGTSAAKYSIRGNTMDELERKRGTPDVAIREEWNGGDKLY